MTYTLVDSPLTPYSTMDEIRDWLKECSERIELNPDDAGWLEALTEAKERETIAAGKA